MWLVLLPSKYGAVAAIKCVQAAAERKTGKKLLTLYTDRGGEFTAMDFTMYCAQLGLRHELTAPHTHPNRTVSWSVATSLSWPRRGVC